MTVYWAKDKADYFIYGCPDLHIGVDYKPLLAFFRLNPKPLDQIVNKRLRKYVSEVNTSKFKISTLLEQKIICQTRALDFQAELLELTKERRALKIL